MIYDQEYFWRRRAARYQAPQHILAGLYWRMWHPERVFDAGCGVGYYLDGFRALGCQIAGCDVGYPTARRYMAKATAKRCFAHDLALPLPVRRGYDLVLCLDVAEHMPAEAHPVLCETLRRLARGPLLFVGGLPENIGWGHVACKPREHWIAELEAAGLHWQPEETREVIALLDSVGDPLDQRGRTLVFRKDRNRIIAQGGQR
jgi:SAM-dependent methyltransferase